jgi:hypothetical protein
MEWWKKLAVAGATGSTLINPGCGGALAVNENLIIYTTPEVAENEKFVRHEQRHIEQMKKEGGALPFWIDNLTNSGSWCEKEKDARKIAGQLPEDDHFVCKGLSFYLDEK